MFFVALCSAIGLEYMAPLGAVAIGGFIVGTFLTLLFIPLIFIIVTKVRLKKNLRLRRGHVNIMGAKHYRL